ncbi:MAG: S26 family signal peptidase [Hyphomonas sp.]
MKLSWLSATAAGLSAVVAGLIFDPQARFIWNRTGSAPEGLYVLSDEPIRRGMWVIVSAQSSEAEWVSKRGYIGDDWPLIKRVAALPGDEICREGNTISINHFRVAEALEADSLGRQMPQWSGCHVLESDEVFLLNDHPRSLDGRYFGPTRTDNLVGVAVPLYVSRN